VQPRDYESDAPSAQQYGLVNPCHYFVISLISMDITILNIVGYYMYAQHLPLIMKDLRLEDYKTGNMAGAPAT